jgi:hypothetical protein
VVYVGEGRPRLIECDNVPKDSEYISLSHCWGSPSSGMIMLTKQTLESFKKMISPETLPQTFRDAMHVARFVGTPYLWIDSLCIIQDSKEDWQREALRMWEVYAFAFLNISTTASRSSSEGLFRIRHKTQVSPCVVDVGPGHPRIEKGSYLCYDEDDWIHSMDMRLRYSRMDLARKVPLYASCSFCGRPTLLGVPSPTSIRDIPGWIPSFGPKGDYQTTCGGLHAAPRR